MTDPPSAPPPGWHLDPAGSGRLRFWDGRAWTDQYATTTSSSSPPPQALVSARPDGGGSGGGGFWKFWSTLPGVLTGLAALVGAVAGVVVLFQSEDDDPPTPPSTTVAPQAAPAAPAAPPSELNLQEVGNLEEIDEVDAQIQTMFNNCAAGDVAACAQIQQALADECFQGFFMSCDVLFQISPVGSDYEFYGATCGNRILDGSFQGNCQFL